MRDQSASISPRARAFVAAYALNMLGSGLLYPYLSIYLATVKGVPVAGITLAFAVAAATSIGVAPYAGRLVDRRGTRCSLMLGCVTQCAAVLILYAATNSGLAISGQALFGIGSGVYYSALLPGIVALGKGESAQSKIMALRNISSNAGLVAGVAAGGLVAELKSPSAWFSLFTADAASFLIFATVCGAVLPRKHAVPDRTKSPQNAPGFAPLNNAAFRRLLLYQVIFAGFGVAQLESAITLLLKAGFGLTELLIGSLFVVNTITVIVVQMPIRRHFAGHSSPAILTRQCVLWLSAWILGLASQHLDRPVQWTFLAVAFALVAAGECLYVIGFQPALVKLAPPENLGRYSASATAAWNVGLVIGPMIGIPLASSVHHSALWITMIVGSIAAFVLVRPSAPHGSQVRSPEMADDPA